MVILKARRGGTRLYAQVEAGTLLTEALKGTALEVRTGCNGNGACGMCVLQIVSGSVSPPSLPERVHLSPAEQEAGGRLACQTRMFSDVEVDLAGPRMAVGWRMMAPDRMPPTVGEAGVRSNLCSLCVDLGTSQIRMSLIDTGSGSRLAAAAGRNPLPGTEVISRLQTAADGESEACAESLRQALRQGTEFLRENSGVEASQIRSVCIVGNTAMQALLRGSGQAETLAISSWTARKERALVPVPELAEVIGLGDAEALLIPPLGGFVGSDLLAGILACDLHSCDPSLLIDFGSNTEIALWTGERMLATSVAGSSALEGAGVSCGTPAVPGAVYRIGTVGEGDVEFETIGGGTPLGFTGSGLIDAIALLRSRGEVDERGRLAHTKAVIDEVGHLHLYKADVDAVQRAKSAVASAINYLLDKAGLKAARLRRVFLAGTLGRYLDVASGISLGLLPPLPATRYAQIENAPLLGAELCARSEANVHALDDIAMGTELLNLAEAIGFEELFIEHMHLRPWHGPSAHLAFADIGPPQAGLVKAMQYLSDLRPEEDHLERLGQMVIRLFEADFVAFRDGSGPIRHVMVNAPGTCCPYEKDIADEAAMVLESGFMSILPPIPGRPASVVLMPMQVEEHTLVFVIGHEIPEEMPRDRLDIYLALARNAGAILTRLAQERELAAHRTHLAKLVEERTRELEKMNALLRTEMEMRARDEEAIRLANKKLNLLSSMTRHDIINQVTAVLGYVHLMETKGLPPEKMVRYLGKIEAVTTTIQRLIEFTRDYQDLGVKGPTWQQIDEDFWKAAVAFRDSGITYTSEVEGVEIFSDQMLNKVFHNLIDNTIRHGEHARQCGLSYGLDGEWLVLHYRDDGVGIPEEEKSLVFERGFGKNTGLGLFLVREILSITGMEIAEVGTPGKGVDFAIRVPPGGFQLRDGKAS